MAVGANFPNPAYAPQPNESFNADANTGHAFGILLASVGALRPYGLRRRLTQALGLQDKITMACSEGTSSENRQGQKRRRPITKDKSRQTGCLRQGFIAYREGTHRSDMSCGDRKHGSKQAGCLRQGCLTYREEKDEGKLLVLRRCRGTVAMNH